MAGDPEAGLQPSVDCPGCDYFGWKEPDDGRRNVSHDFIGFSDLHTWGGGARLDWDAGNFDFVSITDWYHVDKEYMEDSDGTPYPVLETFLANNVEQFSQEIRISGETDSFRWVGRGLLPANPRRLRHGYHVTFRRGVYRRLAQSSGQGFHSTG